MAALVAPALLLAACSGGDGSGGDDASASTAVADDAVATSIAPNGSIEDLAIGAAPPADVEGQTAAPGAPTEVPTITYGGEPFAEGDLPFSVAQTEEQQVTEGEGEGATAEQQVELRYLAVNGTSGEEIVSTYPSGQTVVMDLADPTLIPGFQETLLDKAPGEAFIVALPPDQAFGPTGNPDLGVAPADTLVFYMEVVDVTTPLTQAEGTPVEPVEGLPTVEADGTSPAQITIPEGEEPPTELVVQPLIEGEGEPVQAGQQVTFHYTGVQWSNGEQFDSSLETGQPFPTQIGVGQVIPGWDEGLVGQPVGSRVLLVIPPGLAYGASQEGQPGYELREETLVFVVDILDAR